MILKNKLIFTSLLILLVLGMSSVPSVARTSSLNQIETSQAQSSTKQASSPFEYSADLVTTTDRGNFTVYDDYADSGYEFTNNSYADTLSFVTDVVIDNVYYETYFASDLGGFYSETFFGANTTSVKYGVTSGVDLLDANIVSIMNNALSYTIDVYYYDVNIYDAATDEWLTTFSLPDYEIYADYGSSYDYFYWSAQWAEVNFTYSDISVQVDEFLNITYEYSGAYVYYYDYQINQTGYEVTITDNNNVYFNYMSMFETSGEYFEYAYLQEDYFEFYEYNVSLTFNENFGSFAIGDPVPIDWWPSWAVPYFEVYTGSKIVEWSSSGSFDSISVAQSYVSAVNTKLSNDTQMKAIWGNFQPGIILAYHESTQQNNDTSQLEMRRRSTNTGTGNQSVQSAGDRVLLLGLLEAYMETGTFYADYYDDYYYAYYDALNDYFYEEDSVYDFIVDETWTDGYGNVNVNTSMEYYFDEPSTSDNKTYVFAWGVSFTDFPINWVEFGTPNTSVYQEQMDFSFDYVLTINLEQGSAKLSTTSYYGAVTTNSTALLKYIDGASLAVPSYSVVAATLPVDQTGTAAQTNSTRRSEVRLADNSALASIDFGGAKADYTLTENGVNNTYTTQTAEMILTSASSDYSKPTNVSQSSGLEDGTVRRSRQARMDNATAEIASNDTNTENVTQNMKFIYKESLILTSYPSWSGNALYHDPTFTVVFTPVSTSGGSGSSGSTSGAGTGGNSGTSQTSAGTDSNGSTSTPSVDTGSGAPGFEFIVLLSLTPAIMLRRRKKSQ